MLRRIGEYGLGGTSVDLQRDHPAELIKIVRSSGVRPYVAFPIVWKANRPWYWTWLSIVKLCKGSSIGFMHTTHSLR
jgi:hypothetical protein